MAAEVKKIGIGYTTHSKLYCIQYTTQPQICIGRTPNTNLGRGPTGHGGALPEARKFTVLNTHFTIFPYSFLVFISLSYHSRVLWRNKTFEAFSGSIRDRSFDKTREALLKILSEGADVAGIARYILASFDKCG